MLLRCWCDAGNLTMSKEDCQRHGGEREAGGDWGQFRWMLPCEQKLLAWALWEPRPPQGVQRGELASFPVLQRLPCLQATLQRLASLR